MNNFYAMTEAQKKLWYAKYYHEVPAAPSPEILRALEAPLSPEDVIRPDELEKLLDFSKPFKVGYALLDSGVTYSAMETVFTGVTADMAMWYRGWADQLEDQELVYKMWYPGKHIRQIELPGATWAQEDIGCGPENLFITNAAGLDDLGLEKQLEENPQIVLAVAGSSLSLPCDCSVEAKPLPSFLVHVYYINEDGYYTDRVAAWFGASVAGKKLTICSNGNVLTMDRAKGMAEHMAGEGANLSALIREVYAENHKDETPAQSKVQDMGEAKCVSGTGITGTYHVVGKMMGRDFDSHIRYVEDNGVLTGSVTFMDQEIAVIEGAVNGNSFKHKCIVDSPMGDMKIRIEGTVDGDDMTMQFRTPIFKTTLTGKRVG